jgi:hypothetical protein
MICLSREARIRATKTNIGAASERAPSKSRCRRSREPSEEAAGQPAAVVDHDPCGAQASGTGLIWNHFNLYHDAGPRDNKSMGGEWLR